MKKRLASAILALFLVLLLSGCGPRPETGEISFKVPTVSEGVAVYHNSADTPLPVLVSIYSSFGRDIEAQIYLEGNSGISGPYSCWLKASTTSPCNTLSVQTPGVYTLRAEVTTLNGEVVYTQIPVQWVPYSPVETFALGLAGKLGIEDPQMGFNVIVFIFASLLVLAGIALKMGKEASAVIGALILLGIVFFASPEISKLIVEGLFGAASGIIFIYLVKAFFDRMRHFAFVHKNGVGTSGYMGEGGNDGAVVVDALNNSFKRRGDNQLPYLPKSNLQLLPGDRVTPLTYDPQAGPLYSEAILAGEEDFD